LDEILDSAFEEKEIRVLSEGKSLAEELDEITELSLEKHTTITHNTFKFPPLISDALFQKILRSGSSFPPIISGGSTNNVFEDPNSTVDKYISTPVMVRCSLEDLKTGDDAASFVEKSYPSPLQPGDIITAVKMTVTMEEENSGGSENGWKETAYLKIPINNRTVPTTFRYFDDTASEFFSGEKRDKSEDTKKLLLEKLSEYFEPFERPVTIKWTEQIHEELFRRLEHFDVTNEGKLIIKRNTETDAYERERKKIVGIFKHGTNGSHTTSRRVNQCRGKFKFWTTNLQKNLDFYVF